MRVLVCICSLVFFLMRVLICSGILFFLDACVHLYAYFVFCSPFSDACAPVTHVYLYFF